MSTESRIIVGHTINIAYDLEYEDFRKGYRTFYTK